MESLVTLAITAVKCIKNKYGKIENLQYFFKKWGRAASSSLVWSRQLPLGLPLDLGKCHRKVGDASYYWNQIHKEQISKNRKFSVFFRKIREGYLLLPRLVAPTPSQPSSGPREVPQKVS